MASALNLQINSKKAFWYSFRKKISILGFSFKTNTNDKGESAAITICKDLLDEGAILKYI